MRTAITCFVLSLIGLPGTAAAQAQRPELTRAIPLALLCGPQASLALPAQGLKITAGLERSKALFAPGDSVIINGGTAQGLRAGQHFYVRRVVPDRFTVKTNEATPHSIHTAGWLTILEAQADVSVARIGEACDGVAEGDYLEPLVLPPSPDAAAGGEPDYARPASIILGDERRQAGGEYSQLVIDRGSDHGLRPGQRLTIFRRAGTPDGPIVKIGDAIVAATQHETSTMRIERSREAIQVGDKVAIHR